MKSPSASVAFLITFSALFISSTFAWTSQKTFSCTQRSFVAPNEEKKPSGVDGSSLNYKFGVEDESIEDIAIMSSSVVSALSYSTETLRQMDLPRRSKTAERLELYRNLWEAELSLGRMSMLASLLLLAGELSTGMSMMEQISSLLHP